MAITPVRIESPSSWVIYVGAVFGGITLIGLFAFAFIAGTSNQQFICKSFQLLAAVFSLGAALSGAFLGGGAAAQGKTTGPFSIAFGVGGGVAVLVIMFVVFSQFKPLCSIADPSAAEVSRRIAGDFQVVIEMKIPLEGAARFAQGSADNFSDAKTCAQHGGQAKGLVLAAEAKRQAIEEDLRRVSVLLADSQKDK